MASIKDSNKHDKASKEGHNDKVRILLNKFTMSLQSRFTKHLNMVKRT